MDALLDFAAHSLQTRGGFRSQGDDVGLSPQLVIHSLAAAFSVQHALQMRDHCSPEPIGHGLMRRVKPSPSGLPEHERVIRDP
jgi:hypothetical protein